MPSKSGRLLLSATTQTVFVQVLGMAFFYLNSVYLPKATFGAMNSATAVGAVLTVVLSLGMEQVAVRRMAAGKIAATLGSFSVHALVSAAAAGVVLLLLALSGGATWTILFWFYGYQALFYLAAPLRAYLNAREDYAAYARIALLSNSLRLVGLLLLHRQDRATLQAIALLLAATSLLEGVLLAGIVFRRRGQKLQYRRRWHRNLVTESLPHFGSILFDAALSRIDWVLMGLLATAVATAEYSFAFRAFEVVKMPLLIIGTLLLSRMAKWLAGRTDLEPAQLAFLQRLTRLEVFGSLLLVVVADCCWAPAVDGLTGGKYGTSNLIPFLTLSLCIPLHFLVNLLWTCSFSRQQYRFTARATMITAGLNLLGNALLIPLWGGAGAALAYLVATIVQAALYIRYTPDGMQLVRTPAVPGCLAIAALAGGVAYLGADRLPWPVTAGIATAVYAGGCFFIFPVLRADVAHMLQKLRA